jgi:hypothetical protein
MPQPPPTAVIGIIVLIAQFLKDHWLSILLIVVAFVLGFLIRGFLRF